MQQSHCVRAEAGDGVHLSVVTDPKFKHNRLSVNFILPLDSACASDNAVAPHILRLGCRALPDFSSLNARLQELYGASLDAGVSKFGGYQVLEASVRGLDNRYALGGEDITGLCAELLSQIVLDPKLDGQGLFDEKDTALQRRYIQDTIDAEINEKRSYAVSQCLQAMCAGEPVAVRPFGTPETAAAITPQSATAAYRHMLRRAPVEILFAGAGDGQAAGRLLAGAFAGADPAREPGGYALTPVGPGPAALRERVETMELNQSKLVIGMRVSGLKTPREIAAARLFSSLFGGSPFSKLFQNVREKLSLCYYCASRFDSSTHLLLVDCGIEAANKQKAVDEIMRQLEEIAAGNFTDRELAETKLLMRGSLLTVTDSPSATESWYLAQILRGRLFSPLEDADLLDTVTRDELVAAARSAVPDTVYFLTGKGEDQ